MTADQLKRCRAVHQSLTMRIRILKSKLRNLIVTQDILGLGGGANISAMMMLDNDKLRALAHCIRLLVAQTFDNFLENTATAELERFFCSLETMVDWLATDAMQRNLTPRAAWDSISGGFDSVTRRDRVTSYAVRVVLPPASPQEVSP
jgi:hypothetical protein